MRLRLRYILLGLLAFAVALLVVFPAAWLKPALPPQITCTGLAGSLWNGQCSGLAVAAAGTQPLRLDTLDWHLHPLSLLRGRVQAEVSVAAADLSARGSLTLRSGGRLDIAGLTGTVALDHARLAALPAGWTTLAEARDLRLEVSAGHISSLGGVLLARQLRDAQGTGFGDFRLEFPEQQAPPFRGSLTDNGGPERGPMQLQAQLVLNTDQSWQLHGTVVLRPGSPPGLLSALDQLAPADINGLRTFRLEGTAR